MATKNLIRCLAMSMTLLLATTKASAEIVATYSKTSWNSAKETRVIFAAKGLSFASVGYQQANLYLDLYPDSQILFITNLPVQGPYRQVKQENLKKLGYQIRVESDRAINSKVFLESLKSFTSNIRSLEIIGHNGVLLGPWLENGDNRLEFTNETLMSAFAPLFSKNAWVRIQGCNSGWNVAPALSKYWKVPVMGSFTSSSFYYLNAETQRYELFQSIEGGGEVKVNSAKVDSTMSTPQKCVEGMCLSLKPEAAPYHLHVHKSQEAAWLPFMKPICTTDLGEKRCQIALAEAIMTSATSVKRTQVMQNPALFEKMVYQSVCGSFSTAAGQIKCEQALQEQSVQGKFLFPYKNGKMLSCSGLGACKFEHVSIDLRRNVAGPARDTLTEYINSAKWGFSYLRGE